MTRMFLKRMLVLVLPIAVLVSCSADNSTFSGGGIGGTGVTVGPITGFGSIFVNGAELDISNATVTLEGVDDDSGDPNRSLKLGMVVVVRGNFSPDGLTGVATSVAFEDNLEGPVDSVDAGNQLTVLRQTVVVNTSTVFDGFNALSELSQGEMVEVSGLVDANGNILATRIAFKGDDFNAVGELEIKGTIRNLDTTSKTFVIGAATTPLVVQYTGAELKLENSPNGVLENGLFVEVESKQPPSGGAIQASEVAVKSPFSDSLGEEGDHVEIEGFVTEFSSLDQPFKVNGILVLTTAATVYEHGSAIDVANGVRLEVEGTLDADGVLTAVKVEFEDSSG
ncbi:MAG: DUF5666 domain-containing protein [Nitrospirota bacterium]